jgi:predicted DNA-binding protein (MmcQ/YjbR family)
MDAERARAFLLTLPHVAETLQWGDNLLFWVGDKSVGGRMFAVIDLSSGGLSADGPSAGGHGVISFAAGPERALELLELEAFYPAPYLARAHWVATRDWNALRLAEWQADLRNAHGIILAKLPKRTREQLESRATKSSRRPRPLAQKKAAKKKSSRLKPKASGSR